MFRPFTVGLGLKQRHGNSLENSLDFCEAGSCSLEESGLGLLKVSWGYDSSTNRFRGHVYFPPKFKLAKRELSTNCNYFGKNIPKYS